MIYIHINYNENVRHYNIFYSEYYFQKSVSSRYALLYLFSYIRHKNIDYIGPLSAAKRLLLINIFVRDRLSHELYNVDVAHSSADGYPCQVHDPVAGNIDLIVDIRGIVAHEALHIIARLL